MKLIHRLVWSLRRLPERWEYQTWNSTDIRDWQRFGAAGWEIIQVGWGKGTYNVLAKRRLR